MVRLIIPFLILCGSVAQAAAPATHVLYAQLWMEQNYIADPQLFVAGTLFPDIRYLGTISRAHTHEKGITPKKIRQTASPFKAGMRLHVYLDETREKFVKDSKIEKELTAIPKKYRVLFLKVLEDEIYWNQVDTQLAQNALAIIHDQEIEAGVDEETVLAWHRSLTDYFDQRPSLFFKQLALEGKGFLQADAETIAQWAQILPSYALNRTFIDYSNKMKKAISLI